MLLCIAYTFTSKAQIGYQVSLLNTATGEPRANVTVNASVIITNSKGESIYSGSQSATTNDFGVLSLTVGNANTFKNVDFSKIPFFIEVSVDGKMIGRSQILNVPVAEAAKTIVSVIPKEALSKKYTFTWYEVTNLEGKIDSESTEIQLYEGGTFTLIELDTENSNTRMVEKFSGSYEVEGNSIYLFSKPYLYVMRYKDGVMCMINNR